jgi:hypothetical protein
MQADSMATQVMNEVLGLVQSIAQFSKSTIFVYSDDDLQNKVRGANFPAVGIIYNGMKVKPEMSKSVRLGLSGDLTFTLMLIQQSQTISTTDTKGISMNLLDSLRGAILGVRSITGHFYQFQLEAPAQPSKGYIFWGQRWSVPVQLTPTKNNI